MGSSFLKTLIATGPFLHKPLKTVENDPDPRVPSNDISDDGTFTTPVNATEMLGSRISFIAYLKQSDIRNSSSEHAQNEQYNYQASLTRLNVTGWSTNLRQTLIIDAQSLNFVFEDISF
jgi:hypothetical protein